MYIYKYKHKFLFRAIASLLVFLFLVNDLSWADPSRDLSEHSTLAPELRLKPFFDTNKLDFRNIFSVYYVAGELRKLAMSKEVRDSHIVKLNRLFSSGEIEIEKDAGRDKFIETYYLESTGRECKYAIIHFKKENTKIKMIFPENPEKLEDRELREIGVNTKEDREHFLGGELKGVWFVSLSRMAVEPREAGQKNVVPAVSDLTGFTDKQQKAIERAMQLRDSRQLVLDEFLKDRFGLNLANDKSAIIKIAEIFASQDGLATAEHFKNFGLDPTADKQTIIEIAKICAIQNGWKTAQYFKNFGLVADTDKEAIINIAELCASTNVWVVVHCFKNFGLDPTTDKQTIIEIAKICAIQNGWKTAQYFKNFGLNPATDILSIIEIARLCYSNNRDDTDKYFDNFGLEFQDTGSFIKAFSSIKGQNWPIILSTIGVSTGFVPSRVKMRSIVLASSDEERTRISILTKQRAYREYAKKSGITLSEYPIPLENLPSYTGAYMLPWDEFVAMMDKNYDQFHKTPDAFIQDIASMDLSKLGITLPKPESPDMAAKIDLTTFTTRQKKAIERVIQLRDSGESIIDEYIKNFFFLDFANDKKAIIAIAYICAEANPRDTAHCFSYFRLNASTDKQVIAELANICAAKDPWHTAQFFRNFGLNSVTDIALIIEIAQICYQRNRDGADGYFHKFGLEFQDTESFIKAFSSIKGQNWPIILSTIGVSTGFVPSEDEMKTLVSASSADEMTRAAILIKQRAYREYAKKSGITLSEYPIPLENLPSYTGAYMLPWDEFVAMMDKNYDQFHKTPDAFIQDISKIDLSKLGITLPKPEAPDMAKKKEPTEFTDKQKKAIREVLRYGAQSVVEEFIKNKFGLNPATDKEAIIKMAKMCATQNAEWTAKYFKAFGLDAIKDKQAIIEIAKICVNNNIHSYKYQPYPDGVARYFKNFGLDPDADKEAIIEIAKICANRDGTRTAIFFKNFGLDPVTDREAIIEIARICIRTDGGRVASSFKEFGIDPTTDKEAIIEIAKICVMQGGIGLAQYFNNFGLDSTIDKEAIIEIAKICASQKFSEAALHFNNFGLDPDADKKTIIEIAKILASHNGRSAAQYFNNFGLDPIIDKEDIIEIAKICAMQDGGGAAQYFNNFGLGPTTDKETIIEIAKMCAMQDGGGAAQGFNNFGLSSIADKQAIIEIAKICASNNGYWTSEHFKNFGLDPTTDISSIIDIAQLCYQNARESRALKFKNFGLVIFNKGLSSIKGQDWPIILSTIGVPIGLMPSKKLILAHPAEERTIIAILAKQRAYREHAKKSGITLSEYPIPLENLPSYTGAYMLPWKEFVEMMDKNYDQFHKTPDAFMQDIGSIDLSTLGVGLPKLEAPDMAMARALSGFDSVSDGDDTNPIILKAIDGDIAVEVDESAEKVTIINRERTKPRASSTESNFYQNGTFNKIRSAKEETILRKVILDNKSGNLRNLSDDECERLLRIVQSTSLSVLLGRSIVGETEKEYKIVHVRTGYSRKIHGLDPTIWIGEGLLNSLSVEQLTRLLVEEAQHILKPPQLMSGRWINIHGSIADASNPSEVIEHDRSFIEMLSVAALNSAKRISGGMVSEGAEAGVVTGEKQPDMAKKKAVAAASIAGLNLGQITGLVEKLIWEGKAQEAEDAVTAAITQGVHGLTLDVMRNWAEELSLVSPAAADRIRAYQRRYLEALLNNQAVVQQLFMSLHQRFSGVSSGMGYDKFGEDCRSILNGTATSGLLGKKHEILLRNRFEWMLGYKAKISDYEAELIRTLSVDITRTISEARASRRLKNVGELSFREGMRFLKIFSRYYLSDMETAKSRIFEYFTLVAWSVYGRFIRPEDREAFAKMLVEVFNREAYRDIFLEASAASGREVVWQEALNIFDFGRFDSVTDKARLPAECKVLAAVERARASNMPAFIFTPSSYFPDMVVQTLSEEPGSVVFPLSMSGFTQRKEFFGMHMPDSTGHVKFLSGAIGKIIEYAKAHPKEMVYFVLENPDFASGDVRMALHQLLLERKVTLDEAVDETGARKGETALPDNMQVVLTMDSNSDVGDESFMDRASGCFMAEVKTDEIEAYLIRKVGLPENAAKHLVDNTYVPIRNIAGAREKINIQDIVQIGYYLAGRMRDGNIKDPDEIMAVARQEAALHLSSKFSSLKDGALLAQLKKILGELPVAKTEISQDGKRIDFSGVIIDISPASAFGSFVARLLKENKKAPMFADALKEFLPKDYFLTDAEEHIFSLLARVYKYAPSKIVFLQGLPGGGKTTIARVFLDVVGCAQKEYTLNKEASLSLFRGSLALNPNMPDGLELRTAEYWKDISRAKTGEIVNEADTRIKFIQWLWPEIAGRSSRFGWEFASSDTDNPMGRLDFGKGGMHTLTGNVRRDMPPVLEANIPGAYYMERSKDDMLRITQSMFTSRWLKMPSAAKNLVLKNSIEEKALVLGRVYNAIVEAVHADQSIFLSKREVTPRQIERFKDLLFDAIEKGEDIDVVFDSLLHVVFVYMWDNPEDMRSARGIILTQVADLAPPPSSSELLDFVKEFPLDIPVLIMTNGTVSFNDIRSIVMSSMPDTEENIIPLSRFHTKKSLIGGIAPTPEDKAMFNKIGILPHLILKSHLGGHRLLAWMPGYMNLNPQVAPMLNEFFQTNWLSVEEILDDHMVEWVVSQADESGAYKRLISDYNTATGNGLSGKSDQLSFDEKRQLAKFLIGYKPANLVIRAVGTAEEPLSLHPADIDRFFTVNVSEEYNREWARGHAKAGLAVIRNLNMRKIALKCVETAFELFDKEKEDGLYDHNRLSPLDIDIFLGEIRKHGATGRLSEDLIKLLAYQTMAQGLTIQPEKADEGTRERDYRREYLSAVGLDLENVIYSREYASDKMGTDFIITAAIAGEKYEIARCHTQYDSVEKIDEYGRFACLRGSEKRVVRLQADLQSLLSQQASQLIFASRGTGVALEGDPGGGKTSGARDLAKAAGRLYHEEGMYKWITLGSLLGSLGIRGKEILLTTLDKDKNGHYLLPFLRMYSEGGSFIADEGMVSKGAGYLLRWMAEVGLQDEIDLGTFHPGLQGVTVKRHPEFTFAITQNDHFKTAGRKPIPWEIDRRCGKIRVDNVLSMRDCRRLVDYYLEGRPVGEAVKSDLAKLHILLSKKHPQKRMVSPRDLIDTVLVMREAAGNASPEAMKRLVYEAVGVNYVEGLINAEERSVTVALIKEILPNFSMPDYSDLVLSKRGYSNVDSSEVIHLQKSPILLAKARAMERMLEAGARGEADDLPPARQVLINEEPGASGMEFLKLFCHLTGRKLETIEGHPYLSAKRLLVGESFEFEPEFDTTGHRRAKDDFRQTHGALRRYLIRENDLAGVSADQRIPTVIAITNIESIPKNELVKLNELIATRSILLKDDAGELSTFVLPPWITIVPITSDLGRLTSPFANRFRKMGLGAVRDEADMWQILSSEYPNLTLEETKFILDSASIAQASCESQGFEMGYDFIVSDVNELALRIQMYKQSDSAAGIIRDDPFWYVIKAITYVYLQAMCPQDRAIYLRSLAEKVIAARLKGVSGAQAHRYVKDLVMKIRSEDRKLQVHNYEQRVDASSLSDTVSNLENGMRVHRREDTVTIITDNDAYTLSWNDLAKKGTEGVALSGGLTVRREGDVLVLREKLFAGSGISRFSSDEANLMRAVPSEEMGVDDFMHPADALVDSLNALAEAQTPVMTATGRLIRPRVVLMAGETGSGKTTIPRMLSKAEGTPLVRINPWRQMQATKLTVSLALGKQVEMTVSDFLLSCGKINGKRISAAYPTSSRIRILVDEANVTRDVWYVLDAIARGEKSFTVETPAGDAVLVELDQEVDVILTYNPPERYGGTGKGSNRYKFPAPIARKAIKVYTSEPLEDYSDEEMKSIMKEVYRRGEAYFGRKAAIEKLGLSDSSQAGVKGGFIPAGSEILQVKQVAEGQVKSPEQLSDDIRLAHPDKLQKIIKDGESKEDMEARVLKEREALFEPDIMRQEIDSYGQIKSGLSAQDRYTYFMNRVLLLAILGIAREEIGSAQFGEVVILAGELDPELATVIGELSDLSREQRISMLKVRAIMARLDRVSRRHKVYLEDLNANKGKPVIKYVALNITNNLSFDLQLLKDILGEDVFRQVFGDSVPDILVVMRPEDGILGYYDGRDMVVSFLMDDEKELEVASHELGHLISEEAAKHGNIEVREHLLKNVELYSHLFPIMLVSNPKRYIEDTLLEKISNRVDNDDAYALASIAALNAYCIEYAKERVTKEFEKKRIDAIVKKLNSLGDGKLRELAIKFWNNPPQYFPVVESGNYYQRQVIIKGGKTGQSFSLSSGTTFRPRIKVIEKIEIKMKEDGEAPEEKEFIEDEAAETSGMAAGGKKELPPISRMLMKKYEEFFAPDDNGDDVEVRFVSEGGDDVNAEAKVTQNADELLIAPEYEEEEKALAQNVLFVIDVSGSIQSAPDLQDALETMLRHYLSFLLELSRKNPDLNIGLATISTKMDILFDFNEWKRNKSHVARRALLEEALERIWKTGDGGGIDTPSMLDKLAGIEFPETSAKDVKNLVVIFTDGQEAQSPDRAHGPALQDMVRSFRDGKYLGPDGAQQVQALKHQHLDMAFVGVQLTDGGADLEKNYPSFLNMEGESADDFFREILKLGYMQAKNILIDGDLAKATREIGKKAQEAEAASRAKSYSAMVGEKKVISGIILPKPEAPDMATKKDLVGFNDKQKWAIERAMQLRELAKKPGILAQPVMDEFIKDSFGLDPSADKPAIIEIAKICAIDNGNRTSEYFNSFGLNIDTDKEAIIEIAKICLGREGWSAARYFKNYGLNPVTDNQVIIELAKICASKCPISAAEYFKIFGLNPVSDKKAIIEIAKICAERDGWGTAEHFKEFGLDPDTDKPVIIEIAKICAKNNGGKTAQYFNSFGLSPDSDMFSIIEIAQLCYRNNRYGADKYFDNFGISFEDTESFIKAFSSIKGQDWPIVLSTIGVSTGFIPSKDEMKSLVLASSSEERTRIAILIKQKAYREYAKKSGIMLNEYSIPLEKLPSYTGAYMLPWDQFVEMMDKNYDQFHKTPDAFTQDIATMDLSKLGITLPKPEAPDMAALADLSRFNKKQRAAIERAMRLRDADQSVIKEFVINKFGLNPATDKEAIIEIVKMCAIESGWSTAFYFRDFGLNPATDKETIIEIAKICASQRYAEIAKFFGNFGLDPAIDKPAIIEIARICAKNSGGMTAGYFKNFGFNISIDKEVIIEIAKICASSSGSGTSYNFKSFGLNPVTDMSSIIDIAQLCYRNNAEETDQNFENFGLLFKNTKSMIATFSSIEGQDWPLILRTIGVHTGFAAFALGAIGVYTGFVPSKDEMKNLVIASSAEERTRVAILIKQRAYREYSDEAGRPIVGYPMPIELLPSYTGAYMLPWDEFVAMMDKYYDQFHKTPDAFTQDIATIDISKLGITLPKPEASDMAKKIDLTGFTDKQKEAIKRAMELRGSGRSVMDEFIMDRFGLDPSIDKQAIIEIAKICADRDGWGTTEYFNSFGLDPKTDSEIIIEIAKICASSNGWGTEEHFNNFGLDPAIDKQAIIEIAKICARSNGGAMASRFRNFGLNPITDKQAFIEIAKICANHNVWAAVQHFKDFGLDPATDKQAIVEIAKICSEKDGGKTAEYFKNFGLEPVKDLSSIIKIAHLCYRYNRDSADKYFDNFGISFQDTEAFIRTFSSIKGQNWPIILSTIGVSTGFVPSRDEMKSLILASSDEERAKVAILIKQRAYREHAKKSGIILNEYPIQLENLTSYTGAYMLPWKEFVEMMDKDYDQFHKTPDVFIQDIGSMDLSKLCITLPKPEAPDIMMPRVIAEAGRIHAETLKYLPSIPEKTILCHITADSILPDSQRKEGILNRIDKAMRDRSYSEKIVELKVDSSKDFIQQVQNKMQEVKDYYKDEYGDEYNNYTFKFDVACPNTDIVAQVQARLGLPALAFSRKDGDIVQIEGILLALRALHNTENSLEALCAAFETLTGSRPDLSGITNVNDFAVKITFILPATASIDYNKDERLNRLIEEHIKTAA